MVTELGTLYNMMYSHVGYIIIYVYMIFNYLTTAIISGVRYSLINQY